MDSSAIVVINYGPFQMSTFTWTEFKTDKDSFAFFSEHVKVHTLKG